MTVDFESEFETADTSEWDAEATSVGESITALLGSEHWGSYGARIITDGSGADEYAYVRHNCDYSEFYARMFIYIDSMIGWDDAERVAFFWATDVTQANDIFDVGFTRVGGGYRWYMRCFDNGGIALSVDGAAVPLIDTWYCVEVYYKQETGAGADDGIIRVWANGVLLAIDLTDIGNIEQGNVGRVLFGGITSGTFEVTLCGDDFAIGDTRMGCEIIDESSCEDEGYYWYDGSCHETMSDFECDTNRGRFNRTKECLKSAIRIIIPEANPVCTTVWGSGEVSGNWREDIRKFANRMPFINVRVAPGDIWDIYDRDIGEESPLERGSLINYRFTLHIFHSNCNCDNYDSTDYRYGCERGMFAQDIADRIIDGLNIQPSPLGFDINIISMRESEPARGGHRISRVIINGTIQIKRID